MHWNLFSPLIFIHDTVQSLINIIVFQSSKRKKMILSFKLRLLDCDILRAIRKILIESSFII